MRFSHSLHTFCRTVKGFNSWIEHKIQHHFVLTMKCSWQSWQRTRSNRLWTNLWFSVVVPPNLGSGKQGHCTASFHAVSALWIKKELQSPEPQIQHLSPVNCTTSLKQLKQEKYKYNCYRKGERKKKKIVNFLSIERKGQERKKEVHTEKRTQPT